jgi:hypothetical protein
VISRQPLKRPLAVLENARQATNGRGRTLQQLPGVYSPENVQGLRGDEAWLGVPAGSSRMPAKLDASLTRTGESLYSSGSRNEHLPRDEVTNGLVSLCSRA